MDFVLHIPRFEGPLDLLLYLIEKNKFSLEDLQICPIIDQYLEYMNQMKSLNIDLASEFLDMSSYLLWLKSCLLLPVREDETQEQGEDPIEELRQMLAAYKEIKEAALKLNERPLLYRDKFPRGATTPQEKTLAQMNITSLMQAIVAIKARTKKYIMKVEHAMFSISEMIDRIASLLRIKKKIVLDEVAKTDKRIEIITIFLAALELSKNAVVRLIQKGLFEKIYLIKRGSSLEEDVDEEYQE